MNQISIKTIIGNWNVLTCISDLPTNFDKTSTSYLMNKYIKVIITNG